MSADCGSCRRWQRFTDTTTGDCRAMPPTVVAVEIDNRATSVWPETAEDDWCAHHVPTVKAASMGDDRPGAATVEIEENGIVRVTLFSGEQFELSALEGLSDEQSRIVERMAWFPPA